MIFNKHIFETRMPLILGIVSIIFGFFIVYCSSILFFPTLFIFPTISDLANFATLIATIILIFTILEMKEQRKTTYKPLVIVSNSEDLYYQFIYHPERNHPFFFEVVNKDIFIENETDVKSSLFRIKSFNIGLGAAKNIKIHFKYDVSKFVEMIQQCKMEKELKISYNDQKVKILYDDSSIELPLNNSNIQSFDYLLPANVDNNPLLIKLPKAFEFLYSAMLFSKFYSQMKHVDFIKIPDVNMTVTYSDIAGNETTDEYLLKFKHFGIQGTFFSTFVYAQGFLEIKSV